MVRGLLLHVAMSNILSSRSFQSSSLLAAFVLLLGSACAVESPEESEEDGLSLSATVGHAPTDTTLTREELALADLEAKQMVEVMQHLRGGKALSSLDDEHRRIAAAAFTGHHEIANDLQAYPTIRAVLAELDARGVAPIDYLQNLQLAPSANTEAFMNESFAFYADWRHRFTKGVDDGTDGLAFAPAAPAIEPVTITVISIVVTVAGIATTFAQMSGSSNETIVEVPRWVCSKRVWDPTVVEWRKSFWIPGTIYGIRRGWVCKEIQCLVTHVPESLVPNIQQCPMVGQRHGI